MTVFSGTGVDISRYQDENPPLDFYIQNGVGLVTVAGTDSNEKRDHQIAAVRSRGLVVGQYVYIYDADTPGSLAQQVLKNHRDGDAPVTLDPEVHFTRDIVPFFNEFATLVGHTPIIYANRGDYDRLNMGRLGNVPLWHAAYPYRTPSYGERPTNAARDVTMWQFTNNFHGANTDASYVYGLQLTGSTSSPAAPSNGNGDPNDYARKGDHNGVVGWLQNRLHDYGYWYIQTDLDFGDMTLRALTDYQGHHGLTADGVMGPLTRRSLEQPVPTNPPSWYNRVLSQGARGADVSRVQARVFNTDTTDGSFGPKTQAQVKSFQAVYGLTQDGVIGPVTAAKIGE